MVWLILEGVLALLLFVFIIWWTLPRKRDQNSKPTLTAEDAEDAEEVRRKRMPFPHMYDCRLLSVCARATFPHLQVFLTPFLCVPRVLCGES